MYIYINNKFSIDFNLLLEDYKFIIFMHLIIITDYKVCFTICCNLYFSLFVNYHPNMYIDGLFLKKHNTQSW